MNLNMLVGEMRTVSVTNSSGKPVTRLHWITTDPTIVSLSTDDPPVLTAVAAGSATVYAGVAPVSVTVNAGSSLPSGTAIWSLPLGGSSELHIVPAVPSSSGVDVFANNGTLSAISSDGSIKWQASGIGYFGGYGAYTIPRTSIIPDFSGNAVVKSPFSYIAGGNVHSTHVVNRLDPVTHGATTLYTFSDKPYFSNPSLFDDNASVQVIIPDTTGVLFVQDNASVSMFTLSTGAQIGSAITLDDNISNGIDAGPPYVGRMIVAGDGNAYVPFVYDESTSSSNNGTNTVDTLSHLMVMRVSPDGAFSKIGLKDLSSVLVATNQGNTSTGSAFAMNSLTLSGQNPQDLVAITNGGTGAAVFAPECPDLSQASCGIQELASFVSQDSVTSQAQVALSGFLPTLQREDGSYIGVDLNYNVDAVALDGGILWQQALTSFTNFDGLPRVTPVYATADAGVIVTTTIPSCAPGNIGSHPIFLYPTCQLGENNPIPLPYSMVGQLGTLYTLDQYGNMTSQAADIGASYSWTGQWYSDPPGTITQLSFPILGVSLASFNSIFGGNPSHTGASLALCPCLWQAAFGTDPGLSIPSGIPNVKTDLILVGDQGRNNGPGHDWNVGNLFKLAAKTQGDALLAIGDEVKSHRISSVSDFDLQLTTNGVIDGRVFYFGHAGAEIDPSTTPRTRRSALFIGQDPVVGSNLTSENVISLHNTHLGLDATITLNTCDAGLGGRQSIAQLIANRLRRKVYAYQPGMFFRKLSRV